MKRIISILLCLCVVLSLTACFLEPDPGQILSPAYDTAPTVADMGIHIDGNLVKNVYQKDEVYYIDISILCDILGGSITTEPAMQAPYNATLTINDVAYTISNTEPTLNEGETAHPLVHNPIYDGRTWYLPLEPIMSLMGLHLFEDSEQKHRYYTTLPMSGTIVEGIRVPTLMYHAVSDDLWGIAELFVSPSEMDKQLKYLKDNGYTTITFEDLDRLDEIENPVLLTFDDGYDDNYTHLFPLLKKYEAKATVFVITGEIGKQHYLTKEQITEMSASGLISIQSHTVTHPYLSDLTEQELETEMLSSKLTLASLTGKEPFVLCYPTGKWSDLSIQKTQQHFAFGVLMNGGMYTTGLQDIYKIPRFYISRNTDLSSFASKLR